MQVVFFFLALFALLLFVPYPITVQLALDGGKQRGGIKIKLFGAFTVFRLVGVLEDNVLKLYTKKNKYIFIEVADFIADILSSTLNGTPKKPAPTWLLRSLKVDELSVNSECGVQNSIYFGGALNILFGTLYAATKNLSPDCRISVSTNVRQNSPMRLAAVSIIRVQNANIIFRYLKRKRYGTAKSN